MNASRLWVALGSVFALGGLGSSIRPYSYPAELGLVLIALGVVILALGLRLKRGSDTRVLLTVLSMLTAIGVWPLLLVVPAIVLQNRLDSTEWFASLHPLSRD